MILNAMGGKRLPVYGDGSNVRDWLYVSDHCSAVRAVLARGRPGMVYNVGGNSERTNLEVVTAICAALDGLRPDFAPHAQLIQYVQDRPGHDRRYAINSSLIKSELGWQPAERFDTGLRKTIEWYLSNMEWVNGISSGAYRTWLDLNYAGRDTL
jgi:dTDP-glucose 4,6-dehydratase